MTLRNIDSKMQNHYDCNLPVMETDYLEERENDRASRRVTSPFGGGAISTPKFKSSSIHIFHCNSMKLRGLTRGMHACILHREVDLGDLKPKNSEHFIIE